MAYADAVKRGASQTRRHFFIDVCPSFRYYRYRIPLAKDVGRRHRPTERVRFPRARARHLRSRAVSEQRPAGTMTGLRGARWTWTGNSASQEARPELSCGVCSLQQVPRWNADRRRVAWIWCAQTCVHLSAWTRRAPSSALPRKRWRMKAGARRLEIRVCRRSASFFLVVRMKRSEMGGGVASHAIVPAFCGAGHRAGHFGPDPLGSSGLQILLRATDRTSPHVIMATPVPPPASPDYIDARSAFLLLA